MVIKLNGDIGARSIKRSDVQEDKEEGDVGRDS